jgi:hypothetical protein
VSKGDKINLIFKREKAERALSGKFNIKIGRDSISRNKSENKGKKDPADPD